MSISNGEQKIFIWVDFTPETEIAILHGAQVATILKKEICLMYHHRNEQSVSGKEQNVLTNWVKNLADKFGSSRIHTFSIVQPLESILTDMAEEYDALLLVAPKSANKELLPKLPLSGFPFLFVSENVQVEQCYQQIALPVSYMKKSKDLALWSSYFARHNGGKISLIRANAKFAEDNRLVMSIIHSIERLFKNFSFPYEIVETHTPTWKIQKKALEQALCFQKGLLIISFTHQSSFIDRMMGISDSKVIDLSESLSVMCINSQRDLYTFCG